MTIKFSWLGIYWTA